MNNRAQSQTVLPKILLAYKYSSQWIHFVAECLIVSPQIGHGFVSDVIAQPPYKTQSTTIITDPHTAIYSKLQYSLHSLWYPFGRLRPEPAEGHPPPQTNPDHANTRRIHRLFQHRLIGDGIIGHSSSSRFSIGFPQPSVRIASVSVGSKSSGQVVDSLYLAP